MKKFLVILCLSLFFVKPCFCTDDTVYLAIEDTKPSFSERIIQDTNKNQQEEPSFTERILQNSEEQNGENPLSETDEDAYPTDTLTPGYDNNTSDEGTITELSARENAPVPLNAEIEYDVLYKTESVFSKYTTMRFEKGFIEELKPFFAYQGNFNFNFLSNKYDTQFLENTTELALIGKIRNQPIEYKMIFNFLPKDGYSYFQTMFTDDFITLKYIPHNEISIGSFRTPIGVEGGMSGYTLPFLTRSQISRNFGSVRGVGFKVMGSYSLADYNIGMTSADRRWKHLFPGAEFNGWVNFKPLGRTNGKYGVLKIGGGLNAGHNDFDYNVAGAYVSYKVKKISIRGEYAVSHGSNGLAGLTRNKAYGVYTTITYNLTKKLQLLARYDYFNSDMEKSGRNSTEYTVGLNYFVKGSALKFMLNYVFCQSDYKDNSNRIMLGTQIIL